MIKNTYIKFAPVFEGWGYRSGTIDGREEAFVCAGSLYSDPVDAQKYANSNTGNYPYCTTGRVVKVKVVLEEVK